MFKEKVEKALEKVKPYLKADGADVQLIEAREDGTVIVKLLGACGGCPGATYTLKVGIENFLKKEVPEVKTVESAF